MLFTIDHFVPFRLIFPTIRCLLLIVVLANITIRLNTHMFKLLPICFLLLFWAVFIGNGNWFAIRNFYHMKISVPPKVMENAEGWHNVPLAHCHFNRYV